MTVFELAIGGNQSLRCTAERDSSVKRRLDLIRDLLELVGIVPGAEKRDQIDLTRLDACEGLLQKLVGGLGAIIAEGESRGELHFKTPAELFLGYS